MCHPTGRPPAHPGGSDFCPPSLRNQSQQIRRQLRIEVLKYVVLLHGAGFVGRANVERTERVLAEHVSRLNLDNFAQQFAGFR